MLLGRIYKFIKTYNIGKMIR